MENKFYELREYEIAPMRMKPFLDRFADVVVRLFEKYQIKVVLFLEPHIGASNQAIFIIEWNSLAEREQRWDAFKVDPEWLAISHETEGDRPMVHHNQNTIMRGSPRIMAKLRELNVTPL